MAISAQQTELLFSKHSPESVSLEMLCPGLILGDDLNKISSLQELFPDEVSSKWQMRIKELPADAETLSGVTTIGKLPATMVQLKSLGDKLESYEVSMKCTPKSVLGFDTVLDGATDEEITDMIMNLKHTEKEKWGEILREWLVTSVVYANNMEMSFTNNGAALSADEMQVLKNSLHISYDHSWSADGTLEFRNCMLPVSLGGFVVKGYMEYIFPIQNMKATA